MPSKTSTKNTKSATAVASTTTESPRDVLREQIKTLHETNKLLRETNSRLSAVLENTVVNTNGRRRAPRDPNRPKKSKNGYMFYCEENRAKVREENKGSDGMQIVKILSDRWNNLSDKQKAPYQARAQKDRERYQSEMKTYRPTEATA